MKNALIIEDEAIAAQHLQHLLAEVSPEMKVVSVLQSIEESVEYLQQQPMPNLIFMDIHLADGLCFRIFDTVEITCPIIFTTAYDQYALEAFKVNTLDYLLKPIAREDLERSIRKYTSTKGQSFSPSSQEEGVNHLAASFRRYRSHFLIPVRDRLIPLEVKQIACLYLEDKITHAIMLDGRSQVLDRPLDSIMELLNPDDFFRANRQYIVAHSAIREISLWPISKLALTLCVPTPQRIIVSKSRASEFKQWYTK